MTNELYRKYTSNEGLYVCHKEHFTDKDGFPNFKAFDDFSKHLEENREYRLICMNVDLRKSNAVNYSFGSYILRKFILSFQNCYCFRIQGEKFNIIVEKCNLDEIIKILDAPSSLPNSCCDIYYGMVDEPYTYNKSKELIQKSVVLMYQDKAGKQSKKRSNALIGDKGNTPLELQETTERKFRNTMWYSMVHITITDPEYKELTVYVYPTEFCKPLESIPLIVVVDDMLSYRLLYDKNISFGVDGVLFTVNARFNREGHLNTSVFHTGEGMCEIEINTTEGVCIPANFGKRVGVREIYPIKKNIQGFCDYVILENNKAELNTSGVISVDNKKYGVYLDDSCIDLIPIENNERS